MVAVEVFTHTCIVLSEFSSVPHSVRVLKTAVHNPFCVIREKVLAQCKLDLAHIVSYIFLFFPITQTESKCNKLEAEKKISFVKIPLENTCRAFASCLFSRQQLTKQATAARNFCGESSEFL